MRATPPARALLPDVPDEGAGAVGRKKKMTRCLSHSTGDHTPLPKPAPDPDLSLDAVLKPTKWVILVQLIGETFCYWSGRRLQQVCLAGPYLNLSKNLCSGICEHSSAVLSPLWILTEISAQLFNIIKKQLPRNWIHSQMYKKRTHKYRKTAN